MSGFRPHFTAGYSRLAAWSDLLDRINVFPVADGDTGANLRISLSPLRRHEDDNITAAQLIRSATGNSGNIAAAFFRQFCRVQTYSDLAGRAAAGTKEAWGAVADPCEGTMLSLFDTLAASLAACPEEDEVYSQLMPALAETVTRSAELVPCLKSAGVVDAGSLGMYIFFEGFFRPGDSTSYSSTSIIESFAGLLSLRQSFTPEATGDHCVDVVLQHQQRQSPIHQNLTDRGDSLVMLEDDDTLKIHIHTADPRGLRDHLDTLGEVVHWADTPMDRAALKQQPVPAAEPYHIITDAAGSISRDMAHRLGITLLDSYIVSGETALPESLCLPEHIYALMRQGRRVTTAQASTFERRQHYESACQLYGNCLYLCVGSVYTGNFAAATSWKKDHDQGSLLRIIDTGAASGRLALIVILTARSCRGAETKDEVLAAVATLIASCREYVFIDELKYLVAGGRVSRTGGFFGDLLHMKPVISPTMEGVKKEGVVHSSKGQIAFALHKLEEFAGSCRRPVVMLQYSDNEEWVKTTIGPQIRRRIPEAEILLMPLSLTSGVHMGPGTWSMALAPGDLNTAAEPSEAL